MLPIREGANYLMASGKSLIGKSGSSFPGLKHASLPGRVDRDPRRGKHMTKPIIDGCTFEKRPYSHPRFLTDKRAIPRVAV
jgi:hypothetical protein